MPEPLKNETKEEFLTRCMGYPDMQDYDQEQRFAICQSKWREHKFTELNKLLFVGQRVSFDYDGVLSTEEGKKKAKDYIENKDIVYIISARDEVNGMLSTAKSLGIPVSRIYATGSNTEKIRKVLDLKIEVHYDNNPDVINKLNNKGKLF